MMTEEEMTARRTKRDEIVRELRGKGDHASADEIDALHTALKDLRNAIYDMRAAFTPKDLEQIGTLKRLRLDQALSAANRELGNK